MMPASRNHRRFALAGALADRFKRQSLRQARFEELLLHARIMANAADRKIRRQKL